MNKYIHGTICLVIGTTKSIILNCQNGCSIKCPNLISPRTELTVDNGGYLKVGRMSKIRSGTKIRVRKEGKLIIGHNFGVSNNCVITAYEKIEIGNDVQFGPGVLVYDHDHDFRVPGGLLANRFKTAPIKIGNNVWIGANSIILRGTSIGDNCVIAAGSIVKGEIPANTMAYQKRETNLIQI